MEVLWKTVEVILDHCLWSAIAIHGMIHRFQSGHEIRTYPLKSKLIQHLIATREEVVYNIFLDLYN